MKSIRTLVAIAALAPVLSFATVPGQYVVAGIQSICLTSSGTWYGTTFSGWGGHWSEDASNTYVYGNYAANVGNDSMVFRRGTKGTWVEWRDGLAAVATINPAKLVFSKAVCDPPANAVRNAKSNPQD